MQNVSLHPVAFVLVIVTLAITAHWAVVHFTGKLMQLGYAELCRRERALGTVDPVHDLFALERTRERRQIAALLLSSWTQPHRDVNGETHHEAIDAVLVAKAYQDADIILSNAAHSPIEILERCEPPAPPTFSEVVSSLEASGIQERVKAAS